MLTRLFVAVGILLAGPDAVFAQVSWALRNQTSESGQTLWGIISGHAGIVTVGTGGRILHSLDGRAWTPRASGTTDWLTAAAYGNGRYIAVGDRGMILSSTDAIAWSRVAASATSERLNNIVFADGRFVAVGERATIICSNDGTTWSTAEPTGLLNRTRWLRGLAVCRVAGTSIWVATGQSGTILASLGGTEWRIFTPAFNLTDLGAEDLEAIALKGANPYAGNLPMADFIVVGSNGTTAALRAGAMSLLNPIATTGTTARLRTVACGNGVFVATGENGTVLTAQSEVGPWTRAEVNTTKNLVGAAFVEGTLMLVGEGETILQSNLIFASRLGNLSTRGVVVNGSASMIAGIAIQGSRRKQMLVRGIGPALAQFGVSNPIAAPVLAVYDGANHLIATNSGGSTNVNADAVASAGATIGAFPLGPNARDAALLLTLFPGNYTFHLSNATGELGIGLVEAYDLDELDSTASRAINLSTRGQIVTGRDGGLFTAGFVVQGSASRTLLIRGIGPTLAQFGVPATISDPLLKVIAANGAVLATNDNWADPTVVNGRPIGADEIQAAASATGAFPLAANSKDAALLITLVPGNYTVQVSGANGIGGFVLLEVYDIPEN